MQGGALLVAVIGLQLLLQAQDLLVALVQAPREACHDVPLLHQQALVSVHLQHQRTFHCLRLKSKGLLSSHSDTLVPSADFCLGSESAKQVALWGDLWRCHDA